MKRLWLGCALAWVREKCPEGFDKNAHPHTREQKDAEWEHVVKMTLICHDIMHGNPKLAQLGWPEEALGRNAIAAGFQGQRMNSDWKPNGDFTEAILNTNFDWNGKRQPSVFATENDGLNGVAMLLEHLLTGRPAVFADVRTYWSPDAVQRVTGWTPTGHAKNGFIHLMKMTLICHDIMHGNPKLAQLGWPEEALGRNAIAAGFQGQRMNSDWKPNGDFTEAILNTNFDWNGKRQPSVFATENDGLNGVAMLLEHLLTGRPAVFADVRTYWSPDAVQRVTGWTPTGHAKNGFIHLINSGAAALDACGMERDETGTPVMKRWWEMQPEDVEACLKATDWCPADLGYFRGGGFSSHFKTAAEMPVTMARVNIVAGLGPVLQLAEGYTCVLPDEVHKTLDMRTDPTWPTTWFAPRLTGKDAFRDVYSVMANWGANHGAFVYGHVGADLITLASMLRIPVALHNVEDADVYRPHAWSAFGTKELESADFRACAVYGPRYK